MAKEINYGEDLMGKAETFQTRVANEIEEMTAFNVNKVDVEVKDII